jgi:hypothetical protein
MSSIVSNASRSGKAASFFSGQQSNGRAGEMIFLPDLVFEETEVGRGHIVGMSHKEGECGRPCRNLRHECGFARFGRLSFSDRQRMFFQQTLKELIQGAGGDPFAE